MIAENLRSYLLTSFPPQKVLDVRIGLGYTAAQLEDGSVGTAYTFRHEALGGCSVFRGKRPLSGRSTVELLDYLTSKDPIEAAVGLAVANALVNRPSPEQQEGDILAQLALKPEDRVGMVGYFGPLVGPLKARVCE
ncbi:MAG: hypothetical protein H5T84_04425, partial [Thermoleophilia bacterium]|nr:hypothetical protein [Thermoleophilia bacterium]